MRETNGTRTSARRAANRSVKARSLACRECRDRKVRCDGARPVCDSCVRRGLGPDQCRYPEMENEGNIASSRSHILALQKRINQLEAEAEQRENARHSYASPRSQASSVGHVESHGHDPARHLSPQSSPETVSHSAFSPHHQHHHHAPAVGFQDAPLWPNSLHDVAAAATVANHHARVSPPLTDELDEPLHAFPALHQISRSIGSKISLPSTQVIDDLLHHYFDHDWVVMPIVHRPSFTQRYHRLLHISRTLDTSTRDLDTEALATYCLLFGMLALGQLSKSESQHSASVLGLEFHEQVRTLLVLDVMSKPSLVAVQALLLHARFFCQRGCSHESRLFSNLAYQLATRLQLQRDMPCQTQTDRIERRRTWCACISMLRMEGTALTTGPSASLLKMLSQEVDDEYLEDRQPGFEKTHTEDTPLVTSLFVHSVKLSENILRPIEAFHFRTCQETVLGLSEIVAITTKIDFDLQDWHNQLPNHLKQRAKPDEKPSRLSRQASLMHIRYLEAKAALFRTSIISLIKGSLSPHSVSMSTLTKTLILGVLDAYYSTSVELMDAVALSCSPLSRHQKIISLCVLGTTFSLLKEEPILTNATLNPAVYHSEASRCLALVDRHYTGLEPSVSECIEKLRASINGDSSAAKSMIMDICTEDTPSLTESTPHTHATNTQPKRVRMTLNILDSLYEDHIWVNG